MIAPWVRLVRDALLLLLVLLLTLWLPDAAAFPTCPKTGSTTYTCDTNVAASAHCAAQLSQNVSPGGDFACFGIDTQLPGGSYTCKSATFHGKCSNPVHPGANVHKWNTVVDCDSTQGNELTHWYDFLAGDSLDGLPNSLCVSSCSYDYDGSTGDPCVYEDADGSGDLSEGDPSSCPYRYVGVGPGGECSSGSGFQGTPGTEGGTECTNLDCTPDPPPGGGSGSSGGGSGGGVPSQNAPGIPGGGDGDPSTPDDPSGAGDGTSQSGGEGVPGGDCNPYSNPDCAFSQSGSGSGECTEQPTCAGDPVQCAILYQNWAAMCYDDGEFNNPANCLQGFTCSGDVLLCEVIRQQRTQYCDAYVGSGNDLDVTNDIGFDRDLKDEAQVVDLEGSLEMTGLGFSGSCPSPASFSAFGQSFEISFQPFCQLAPVIRIFVILAALLSAMFIVSGSGKRA